MHKMKELREMSKEDLKSLYKNTLNKVYNLNVRASDEGLKTHEFKLHRRTIARILTILNNGEKNGTK